MTRMPLATASLLALAISLAGCGDDKKAEAPATPAACGSGSPGWRYAG
ncbi:peptidase, partial [Pseudomonas aeruginosa]|nr:peptidase [Pseudomonas aeruginosa]